MPEIQIKHNQGAVLLIFVLIMVIGFSSFFLTTLNTQTSAAKAKVDADVLSQAKEALLGYAISYASRNPSKLPGYLPCPDTNGDGVSDVPCAAIGQSSLGRFPWKTLGLPVLRDNAGECLWYAVSGHYKESPANTLSTESNGQFLLFDTDLRSLNGVGNSETAIAVVFAAGAAVSNQVRSVTLASATECGSTIVAEGVNQSNNYLESFGQINNANGSHTANTILGLAVSAIPSANYSTFIHSGLMPVQAPAIFNDSFTKISPVDYQPVYRIMQQWIGERVRQCLVQYASNNGGKLPWPAILQPLNNPVYIDNTLNRRFGRVASNLINSGLDPLWPIDPDPLQGGTRCFNWGWWINAREAVFVAVDNSIAPMVDPSVSTLTVDTNPATAAILVAGRANVFAQNRTSASDKGTIRNYLETDNIIDAGAGIIPPGNEDFISDDTSVAFFNDYVCTLNLCP